MDTIRSLCIGVSAHQKLDHLQSLVKLLGYESIAVFGDCFDEARRRLSITHLFSCWCSLDLPWPRDSTYSAS